MRPTIRRAALFIGAALSISPAAAVGATPQHRPCFGPSYSGAYMDHVGGRLSVGATCPEASSVRVRVEASGTRLGWRTATKSMVAERGGPVWGTVYRVGDEKSPTANVVAAAPHGLTMTFAACAGPVPAGHLPLRRPTLHGF